MKKNYNYSMIIAVAFLLTASGLNAQNLDGWKGVCQVLGCILIASKTANDQKEMDSLIKLTKAT